MVDYAGAVEMLVDESRTFIDQNTHDYVVIHKTASGGTAQDIAHFFANDPAMASTHYIVGQDGTVVQAVLEKDGAGGNCCLETGHASYLPLGINLNVKTVSIEHVDPASDNSTPLTAAQKLASFKLVKSICERHNIPIRKGDASGGIIGHCDIAPLSRARCPGAYPWSELFAYLQGGTMSGVPAGWRDDGVNLISPSSIQGGPDVHISGRIRDYILANNWPNANVALAPVVHVDQLELSNTSLGSGWQQTFRYAMLGIPDSGSLAGKVVWEWTGQELLHLRVLYAQAQAEIALLRAQPAMLDAGKVKDRLSAISLASANGNATIQQLVTQAIV